MLAHTPEYLSPYEKALRAMILIGTYGLDDLSNTEVGLSLDGILTVSVPDVLDVEAMKKEKGTIAEITGYAGMFSMSTPSGTTIFASDGILTTEEHSENGSVASMRVPVHDTHAMLAVLRKVSAIIEALTGHALNDLVPIDEKVRARSIGTGSWADDENDVHPVDFFISRTGVPNKKFFPIIDTLVSREYMNLGVFDGKWYYPFEIRPAYSSSAGTKEWSIDPKVAVVPYDTFDGVIPFSRKPGNTDIATLHNSIASAISKACSPMLASPVEAAKLANWFANGAHDTLVELGFHRYSGALSIQGNMLKVECNSGMTMSFDLTVLEGHPGRTLADLMDTPNVTCFHVNIKNGLATIDKGPYVVEDMEIGKVVSMGKRKNTAPRTASPQPSRYLSFLNNAPYSEASSKTCADNAWACNYVPSNGIRYAAKKIQNSIDESGGILTPVYPAGLAAIRIKSHDTDLKSYSFKQVKDRAQRPQFAAAVVVDASRCGIKSARLAVNELFAGAGVNAGEGLLMCVLPKDDVSSWSDEERDEMEKSLTQLAEMASSKVIFISADKLDILVDVTTTKTKTARQSGKMSEAKIREEMRKMCSNSSVVHIEGGKPKVDRNRYSYPYNSNKDEIADKILAAPGKWAIAVFNEDRPYYTAQSWQTTCCHVMMALGFLPKGIEHICCVDPGHYNAKRAKMVSEMGVAILFDDSGKAPGVSGIVPSEWIGKDPLAAGGSINRNQVMDFRTYSTSIFYTGPVSDDLIETARSYEEMRLAGRFYDELRKRFDNSRKSAGYGQGRKVSAFGDDIRKMNMFVEKMSYGSLDAKIEHVPSDEALTQGIPEDVARTLDPWKATALAHVIFADIRTEVENERCEDVVDKFGDICEIWRAKLEEGAGMTFDISKVGSWNSDTFQGVGSACGIDTAIEAYFVGVPLEDLLM